MTRGKFIASLCALSVFGVVSGVMLTLGGNLWVVGLIAFGLALLLAANS